jgi:hypothetical protein
MGLPQTWFDMQDRAAGDRSLSPDDIRNGRDIGDETLFNDAVTYTPALAAASAGPRSHIDNPEFSRRMYDDSDNSDQGIFASVFREEAPARPYAGPRSQHDRD